MSLPVSELRYPEFRCTLGDAVKGSRQDSASAGQAIESDFGPNISKPKPVGRPERGAELGLTEGTLCMTVLE